MRIGRLAFAALFALLSVGCTAPTSSSDAPKTASAEAAAPIATPVPPVSQPPPVAAPNPDTMERKPVADALAPNRSCKLDSDCAVKNVGNCCGAFPMCVHKDAKTDPAAVQAQCAKDGMASVCGFVEVSGCQCVQGQCQNLGNGAAVM
jgi:hypothetical protein